MSDQSLSVQRCECTEDTLCRLRDAGSILRYGDVYFVCLVVQPGMRAATVVWKAPRKMITGIMVAPFGWQIDCRTCS